MNRKKVVLLIVEGDSEEILLYERLRELFGKHEIRVEVQRGDILFDPKNRSKLIKNTVGEKVQQFLTKTRFKKTDILAVLHIIDTDGSLIDDCHVKIEASQERKTYYHEDCITVQNENQRDYILSRNEHRSRNIRTMNSVDTVISGAIEYKIFYFSRHVEHVLFNNPNPEGEGKLVAIDQFLKDLTEPIEGFLEAYMPEFSEGSSSRYDESWQELEKENTSLTRLTNIPLLFDFLKELNGN